MRGLGGGSAVGGFTENPRMGPMGHFQERGGGLGKGPGGVYDENALYVLGMRLPLAGVKIPKIGKRGLRSQTKTISHPQRRMLRVKQPHFP